MKEEGDPRLKKQLAQRLGNEAAAESRKNPTRLEQWAPAGNSRKRGLHKHRNPSALSWVSGLG